MCQLSLSQINSWLAHSSPPKSYATIDGVPCAHDLMEDDFEPLEEPLKRTTDWLASKDESRFEELYTAYAAGLYAAQTEQLQNKNNNTQEV